MTKFYFQKEGDMVLIKINTDQSVNAWSGGVVLPENFKAKIISSDSISGFWQELPIERNGIIRFTGGRPNGFEGDGVLFRLLPESTSGGEFKFTSETDAYLNDGLGSLSLATKETFTFGGSSVQGFSDTNPPESFRVSLYKEENLFDGKPVAIFEAKDLESGIAKYEVKEFLHTGEGEWHEARSPYLLNSDVKRIEVRAIDNFGNVRTESLRIWAPEFIYAVIGIVIILVFATYILYNKRR